MPQLTTNPAPNQVVIMNNLKLNGACGHGSSLSIFADSSVKTVPAGGGSITLTGSFSKLPGIGIQINNWYWTREKLPVQAGKESAKIHQNPDNSGAQFVVSSNCHVKGSKAWFGDGIETYLVSSVQGRKSTNGGCIITVDENQYTQSVTKGCCAPPIDGWSSCSVPWGTLNDDKPSWFPSH